MNETSTYHVWKYKEHWSKEWKQSLCNFHWEYGNRKQNKMYIVWLSSLVKVGDNDKEKKETI